MSTDLPRVLLVTKGLDLGGLEHVVVDLALAMARRGVPVEVAVVNHRRSALVAKLSEGGVPVHGLGGNDLIGLRAGGRLARAARRRRYDIVHVHGPLPAIQLRVTPGASPVVTTSHTPLGALHWPTRVGWVLTARRDSATIAVSAAVASSMPHRIATAAVVIPHGIDRAAVAAARSDATTKSDGEAVTALTIASHRGVKNYPNLFQALKLARDGGAPLRLVAIGDGPERTRNAALVDRLGLADSVQFLPPTSDPLAAIAASDLLVVASDYEGQPMVVLEALALGRPVVATSVGRVPELVSPAVGRVVPPGDPVALGAALAEIATNGDLRAAMSRTAKDITNIWSVDEVVDAHLALYAQVLEVR